MKFENNPANGPSTLISVGLGRVQPKWVQPDFAGFCRKVTDLAGFGDSRILTDLAGF